MVSPVSITCVYNSQVQFKGVGFNLNYQPIWIGILHWGPLLGNFAKMLVVYPEKLCQFAIEVACAILSHNSARVAKVEADLFVPCSGTWDLNRIVTSIKVATESTVTLKWCHINAVDISYFTSICHGVPRSASILTLLTGGIECHMS